MDVAEVVVRSSSPDDTRAIGAAAADLVRPGDVLALTGELGAGKTCFVQGLARALGVKTRVTSPTFILVRSYAEGRLPVVHCDVYRLDRLQDVLDLGDEVMSPDAVTCIEWGDAVAPLLPPDRLEVEVVLVDPAETGDGAGTGDSPRRIALRAVGAWVDRLPSLTVACRSWLDGGDG